MSKITRILLVVFIILLAGCNRPQPEPKQLPTDTNIPLAETSTEAPAPDATNTSRPADTPQPAAAESDPTPAEPTIDMTQALEGDLIPLFPSGTDITIHEIHMVSNLAGWAIAVADPGTEHILTTANGGNTWQDVTPPQPLVTGDAGFTTVDMGIWEADSAWVIYAGSDLLWSTKNGGVTWKVIPVIHETLYASMFSVLDVNNAWVFQFLDAGMQKVFTAVSRTSDGGENWELLLDPFTDNTIQSFDKTGAVFINSQYGWLTRDFRGVDPFVHLNLTQDGGFTWEALKIPAPPSVPDVFLRGACGLYDPYLISPGQGFFRLSCLYFENDQRMDQDYLYKTSDSGATWNILYAPGGDIYYISDQIMYAVRREIYRSDDGGVNWQLIRTVNWDGHFSFINQDTAWGVAYDPDDDEYALVKTTDGCNSFSIIKPELISSQSIR